MALGPNSECLQCGHVFLQHEDGCPYCGAGARTRSILEEEDYEDHGDDDVRLVIFNKEAGQFYALDGSFSPWPREVGNESS